jgi:hypothetical protein
MRVRTRGLKVALIALVAVGVGSLGYRIAAADGTGAPTPSGASAQLSPSPLPANPDAGLTDSQRDALHKQAWSVFQQRYSSWLSGLDVTKLDLRSLSREVVNSTVLPGQPSLHDAMAQADLVVVGTVGAILPAGGGGTETNFTVDQVVKGSPASSVSILQASSLFPTPDYKSAIIGDSDGGPLLLPGDRAALLLKKSPTGDYTIESISGWYQITGGGVRSNILNTWGQSFNGKSEADFIQLLKAAQ